MKVLKETPYPRIFGFSKMLVDVFYLITDILLLGYKPNTLYKINICPTTTIRKTNTPPVLIFMWIPQTMKTASRKNCRTHHRIIMSSSIINKTYSWDLKALYENNTYKPKLYNNLIITKNVDEIIYPVLKSSIKI